MYKKNILLIIIILLLTILTISLTSILFSRYSLKKNFENSILPFATRNENTIFKIDKITLFSNCNAKNKTASSSNFTIENLYQYTDIALFIKSTSEEFTDSLDFNITSESDANLDTPTLYNNLANPIVLSYINSNIKSDYTITDTSTPITYDGSLLKKCNVLLNSLNCDFTFDVYIINNLDQEFKCTAFINIPLENEWKSIYDGNIVKKVNTNLNFYRYK